MAAGGEAVRGFILQITYSIERGQAIVELYGVLETGESFLVRDRREKPAFYVEEAQAEAAARLGARLGPAPGAGGEGQGDGELRHSMEGRPLRRVELGLPSDAPPLRDRLIQAGIRCYEADVRFAMRYLMQRGLRASLAISTPFGAKQAPARRQAPGGIDRLFVDPELAPAHFRPARLKVLSIDIETDPQHERLLSIALYGAGAAEVLLVRPESAPPLALKGAVVLPNERACLQYFCERVRELAPDVLTGWNFIDFDLRVLERIARRVRARLELGRGREPMRLRPSRSPSGGLDAFVPGRVVVDGIQLLRSAFVIMESWSLGYVSRQVLGEGKLFEGHDRVGQILDAYENDPQALVDYNLQDARLVLEILDKLHLIDLAVERSLLTGLPIDRVSGSIAAFDFLYMSELAKRRLVAPSIGQNDAQEDELSNLGGHVLEPAPGLWRNVWVCDFKSLYPSLIRTFQIDPLGFLEAGKGAEAVVTAPNGARFSRRPGILPGLLDDLFPRREAAKKAGDAVASQAIKILMNSFYGVLGTSASRFHQPAIAGAITAWGRELLLWSKARIESWGFRVLYGDTDSLFILSGDEDPAKADARGRELVARLNQELQVHIEATWQVASKLELEYEKLYTRLLLLSTRGPHGGGGARKKYAGMIGAGEAAKVELTGLEAVRRDWTLLAKDVQRELYDRLFRERDVQVYLRQVVKDLRAGLLDDKLVYTKALRKSLAEYTATTPPHVAAARKQSGKPGRLITYVMTSAGAEPLSERRHPLDHEHYVQKQIRPVAEPVLGVLGLDFDMVVGDAVQLSLF
jgi:DNA polymerase-2